MARSGRISVLLFFLEEREGGDKRNWTRNRGIEKQNDFCFCSRIKVKGIEEKIAIILCKYCTRISAYALMEALTHQDEEISHFVLVIMKIHDDQAVFSFFLSFSHVFSSSKCQLRFSLASLLLLGVTLHHRYITNHYKYALSPKSI